MQILIFDLLAINDSCFLHGNLHTCITFVCIIAAGLFYCSSGSCSSKVELMSPITNASFMESVLWNSLPIKIKEYRKNVVFNLDKKKHLQITKRIFFLLVWNRFSEMLALSPKYSYCYIFYIEFFFFFCTIITGSVIFLLLSELIDFIFKNIFIA